MPLIVNDEHSPLVNDSQLSYYDQDNGRCCCCLNVYWLNENIRFCGTVLSYNWKSLFLSLFCFISFVGESIFRKSLSTNMYNYRWSMLVLINGLTFIILIIILITDRVVKKWYKKRQRKLKKMRLRKIAYMQANGMGSGNPNGIDYSALTSDTTNETSESNWMTQSRSNINSSGAINTNPNQMEISINNSVLFDHFSENSDNSSNSDSNQSVISSDDSDDAMNSDNEYIIDDSVENNSKLQKKREKKRKKRRKKRRRKRRMRNKNGKEKSNKEIGNNFWSNWRYYLIIALLDVLHMIFVFIPIGILPANIGIMVPFVSVTLNCLLSCCLTCDNSNGNDENSFMQGNGNINASASGGGDGRHGGGGAGSGMGSGSSGSQLINTNNSSIVSRNDNTSNSKRLLQSWQSIIGSIFILVSLYLLVFVDCTSYYSNSNGFANIENNGIKKNGYDSDSDSSNGAYVANLILLILGCIPLSFCNLYKKRIFEESKVKHLQRFNTIMSLFTFVLLLLAAPIAFKIQYIHKIVHNESSHGISNYDDIIKNIYDSLNCLIGINSIKNEPIIDICDKVDGWPISHLVCYIFFMISNRIIAQKLINQSMSGQAIQHMWSIGTITAFCLTYLTVIEQLWDPHNSGMIEYVLSFTWHTGIVSILMLLGLFVVYQRPTFKFGDSGDDSAWIVDE